MATPTTTTKRRRKAKRTADDVLADLTEVADRLAIIEPERQDLYDRRADLFREGRDLDPKVTQVAMAGAARVSETSVINALNKGKAKP